MDRTRRSLLIGVGASITLAGCIGDGGDGGGGDTTPTVTETATSTQTSARTTTDGGGATETQTETATPAPTDTTTGGGGGTSAQEQYPDYNWGQLEEASPVATNSVTLRNASFNPLIAAVTPGTEVTFTNEDSFGHTVTIPKVGVDRQIAAGESTAVTFDELGTYDYVCTVHPPDMLGRIEVTDHPPEATQTITTTGTSEGTATTTTSGGGYY